MNTRTRKAPPQESTAPPEFTDNLSASLEHLSDEELEDMLFADEPDESSSNGLFNLPTLTGLSLIVVGVAYMFQQLGFFEGVLDLSALVSMLPWLAGILIILLGFGVLSWRPNKKKKKTKKAVDAKTGKKKVVVEAPKRGRKKRLTKSRDKKIAGVAGGLAEYFNLDPTLVRIAFVIGTFFNGAAILVYLVLSFVMAKPESHSEEERITIIRDS